MSDKSANDDTTSESIGETQPRRRRPRRATSPATAPVEPTPEQGVQNAADDADRTGEQTDGGSDAMTTDAAESSEVEASPEIETAQNDAADTHGVDEAAADDEAPDDEAAGDDAAGDEAAETDDADADADADAADDDATDGQPVGGHANTADADDVPVLDVFAELGVDPAQAESAPLPQFAGDNPEQQRQTEADGHDAATALVFKAPERGSRRAGAPAGPPEVAEDDNAGSQRTSEDESSDSGADRDSEDDDKPKRRRRRRGGRGRRRGSGAGDKNDGNDSSDSSNGSADESQSGGDTPQGGESDDLGSDGSGGDAASSGKGKQGNQDKQGSNDNQGGDKPKSGKKGKKGKQDKESQGDQATKAGQGAKDDQGNNDNQDDTDNSAGEDGSSSSRRRRRRRSRSRGSGDGGSRDEVTALKGSTRLEAKRQRRRDGRDSNRRRAVITEAEFLARRESVKRDMVVRERNGRTQVAVLEDEVLVEHYVARKSQTSMVGNVYLGRVQNVLPSMEAAFIDIGKGRNAVLYAGEVNWDAAGLEGQPRRIEQALSSGDSVLVQVTKDPVGQKGARLTSQITLAGRYLVLVPSGAMTGISRKLPDTERNRLKKLLKEIVPDDQGVIVRTAAEGASEDELRRDVERLGKQWADIEKKVGRKSVSAPSLLKGEPQLALRVVRDVFNEDFSSLTIAGDEAWTTIADYVEAVAPDLRGRLHHWTDSKDLFGELRIDEQIAKALDRKVWLPSGGSLIIDRTEAMTVVDVNTGKFTGSGGTLEETVTRNNLEAAEEIVRQLRLRDIGGIIVIDFIDMVLEANRDLVLRRLVECLGRDRTRHQVAEVTSLGLVQMTRKRIGQGLLEAFSHTCEHCSGRGYEVSTDAPEDRRNGKNGRGAEDDKQREKVRATLATIAAAAASAHAEQDAKEAAENGSGEDADGENSDSGAADSEAAAETAAGGSSDTTSSPDLTSPDSTESESSVSSTDSQDFDRTGDGADTGDERDPNAGSESSEAAEVVADAESSGAASPDGEPETPAADVELDAAVEEALAQDGAPDADADADPGEGGVTRAPEGVAESEQAGQPEGAQN